MSDIRVETSFRQGKKRVRLESRLGGLGPLALVDLWLWAGANQPDGDLSDMDDAEIEVAANWRGSPGAFVAALREIRFLEPSGHLHNWTKRNGYAAATEARSRHMRSVNHAKALQRRGGVCGVSGCEFCAALDVSRAGEPTKSTSTVTATVSATASAFNGVGECDGDRVIDCVNDCKKQVNELDKPELPHEPRTPKTPNGDPDFLRAFEKIWAVYPRKEGKDDALGKAWKHYQTGGETELQRLANAVVHYAHARRGADPEFTMIGSTFFNKRWRDWINGDPKPKFNPNRNPKL